MKRPKILRPDESEFIARLKSGDADAYEELVRLYSGRPLQPPAHGNRRRLVFADVHNPSRCSLLQACQVLQYGAIRPLVTLTAAGHGLQHLLHGHQFLNTGL